MNPLLLALLLGLAGEKELVMVLPPRGARAAAEDAWVGEFASLLLTEDLARLGVPEIDRADREKAHELLSIPVVSLSRATSIRMAEALKVTRIVEGSFEVRARTVALSFRLLDVARGTLSAPLIASGPIETLPAMVRGLAWDVALAGPVPPTTARVAYLQSDRRPSPPLEAQKSLGAALISRDAAEKRRLLRQALALSPSLDEARVCLARLQVDARESMEALDTLKRMSAGSPVDRVARFLKGRAELDVGRYRDAVKGYQSLVAEQATVGALNNYAIALMRGSIPGSEKASSVLRRAIDLGSSPEPRFNMGWALLMEGEPEAAAFWMKGVLKQDPRDTHAQVVLTWSLRQAGRTDEADAAWKALLAVAPAYEPFSTPDLGRRFERVMESENPPVIPKAAPPEASLGSAHLERGRALLERGDLDAAFSEFAAVASLDPYEASTHLEVARIARRRGDIETALEELRLSLYCRDDPSVRVELADLLFALGRRAEARTEAERSLRAEPDNTAARRILSPP